jgi:hypothetical protein
MSSESAPADRWLLLLHQIPPTPPYFRAKVLRRLSQVGALSVKNSAYLLPDTEDAREDFAWICQEISQDGGAAWLFRAETLSGMSCAEIKDAFCKLRAPEYEELLPQVRALLETAPFVLDDVLPAYRRLSQRYRDLRRIDFFQSPARAELDRMMSHLKNQIDELETAAKPSTPAPSGRVWVTRTGVKVDRIGSAWLIRRFIDPQAAFAFVNPAEYSRQEGHIRFDMFDGEFTHRGDSCTFEVLLADHNLSTDTALTTIAEIIHDIDLKDNRFQRPETRGVARAIEGLCLGTDADHLRLERGAIIFESLYQSLAAPRGT